MADLEFQDLWRLSFADPDRPPGAQFLGVCIAPGTSMIGAIVWSHDHGVNPGGEVAGWQLPKEYPVADGFIGKLMTKAEAEEFGEKITITRRR